LLVLYFTLIVQFSIVKSAINHHRLLRQKAAAHN